MNNVAYMYMYEKTFCCLAMQQSSFNMAARVKYPLSLGYINVWSDFPYFFFLLSFPLIMQMFSPPTGEGGRKNGNVAASEHHSASNYKQGNNTDFNHCLLFVVLLQLLYYIILTLYTTRQSIWPCLSWIDCHVLKCRGRIRLICKFATWCRNNKTYNNCQIYHNTPIPLNTCTYSGILKVVWEY